MRIYVDILKLPYANSINWHRNFIPCAGSLDYASNIMKATVLSAKS